MKKVFLLILFFGAKFLYAQTFDFSFQKPILSVSNNFSYNIVNDISSTRFYDSTFLSVDANFIQVDCGLQGSSENNFVCGLDVGVKFSPFFNFETKVAYLLKTSKIKLSNLFITDSSIELAFYFDWFVKNKINPFLYIETASFFKHYILPTVIFSTGVNYEIFEKIRIGCSISATYINFITVVPYHSEISVSSYVKFLIM